MNTVTCTCGRVVNVRPEMAGKKVKCLACNAILAVPAADLPANALPDAPKPAVTAPGPAARAVVKADNGSSTWKILAASGMIIGIISLSVNIYLASRKSEKTDGRASADAHEVERLKQSAQERSREIDSLRELLAKGNDPEKYEKYFNQIKGLEEQLRKSGEELTFERERSRQLTNRVRDLENAHPSAPSPPKVPAAPAAPSQPDAAPARPPLDKALSELVERWMPSVVVIRTNRGAGSGFFVTNDGFLITNYHVIAGSEMVQIEHVRIDAGNKTPVRSQAQPYAIDLKNDLALLKVPAMITVPPIELDLPVSVKVGDGVFAIGNPGMGNRLLEMSVSNGIVSSLSRQLEDRRFLQTTTPINPGNSGGPLFSMSGKVIGVVTAKAGDKENIGFAVPADLVRALIDGKDGAFRIQGSLAAWESRQGLASKIKYDASRAIPLDASITQFMLDDDDGRILALEYQSNSLLQISIPERKVTKKVFTGSEPSSIMPVPNSSKIVWIANRGSQNLVKIDLDKNAVVETIPLQFQPVYLQSAKRYLLAQDSSNFVHGISLSDKKDLGMIGSPFYTFVYDSRRDHLLGQYGSTLTDCDISKILPIQRELATLKPEQVRERSQLTQELQKAMKQINAPARTSSWIPGFGMLIDEKNGRLYLNRAVVKLDKLDAVLGTFKANPYSLSSDPAVRTFMARFPFLDEILAVSPDGKWAATGTHLFSAATFTVHKEIPIPTPMVAFSRDSKGLYYHDWFNNVIAVMDVDAK